MQSFIGVDIGGTTVGVGLVRDGLIVNYIEGETHANRDAISIVNTVVDLLSEVVEEDTVGVGIGVPGLVDGPNGTIYSINNIAAWRNFQLRKEIENRLKIPVVIDNDANCFALGEYYFGGWKDCKSLVAITLGTGVGAGVIVNGQLHTGILGCAGEVGGIPYLDKDFEAYCSNSFFKTKYQSSGVELFEKGRCGDEFALAAFDTFGVHLGKLLHTVAYILAPEQIVIGGAVAKGAPLFELAMRREFLNFPYKPILERINIGFSSLQNGAVLGASALLLNSGVYKME